MLRLPRGKGVACGLAHVDLPGPVGIEAGAAWQSLPCSPGGCLARQAAVEACHAEEQERGGRHSRHDTDCIRSASDTEQRLALTRGDRKGGFKAASIFAKQNGC